MRKILLIVLSVLAIVFVIFVIYTIVARKSSVSKQSKEFVKNVPIINASDLGSDEEKKLGIQNYPGVKPEVKDSGSTKTTSYETTDSVDGTINILSQDLVSRYKDYELTKTEEKKADAVDGKMTVLTCSNKSGAKIAIKVWAQKTGKTKVEIATDSNFN